MGLQLHIHQCNSIAQYLSISGNPSAPGLAVEPHDYQSYNFTVSPPTPSQCVLSYVITSADGLRNITVNSTDSGSSVTTADSFDLCNNNYSFTVVAMTAAGLGDTSSIVYPQPVSLSKFHAWKNFASLFHGLDDLQVQRPQLTH